MAVCRMGDYTWTDELDICDLFCFAVLKFRFAEQIRPGLAGTETDMRHSMEHTAHSLIKKEPTPFNRVGLFI